VSTVSCPAAGNCAAGGYYLTAAGSSQKYEAFLVSLGKTGLCQVKLAGGKASCTLAAKKLGPGTYHVTASYAGATYIAKSASAAKTLKVTG
jgi:hypothetical protein